MHCYKCTVRNMSLIGSRKLQRIALPTPESPDTALPPPDANFRWIIETWPTLPSHTTRQPLPPWCHRQDCHVSFSRPSLCALKVLRSLLEESIVEARDMDGEGRGSPRTGCALQARRRRNATIWWCTQTVVRGESGEREGSHGGKPRREVKGESERRK